MITDACVKYGFSRNEARIETKQDPTEKKQGGLRLDRST